MLLYRSVLVVGGGCLLELESCSYKFRCYCSDGMEKSWHCLCRSKMCLVLADVERNSWDLLAY